MKRSILLLIIAATLLSGVWASGTAAGAIITAASTNIQLSYSDGAGGTSVKTADADGIADATNTVAKISGILDKGFATAMPLTSGIYAGLVPSESYTIDISLRNNGNANDDVVLSAALTGSNRWAVSTPATLNLIEDQLEAMTLTVVPTGVGGGAFAFERATVDTTVALVDQTAVASYNPFADAYKDTTLEAIYGGAASFSNQFVFEAMGYNLRVLSRAGAVVADPLGGTAAIPGAIIRYTIVVENQSSAPAIDVTVRDVVPNNTHLYTQAPYAPVISEAALAGNTAAEANANQATGTLTFNNLDIPAYGTATINYNVTID
jgi:uncharacterized repeat protein (TIGR01451 family)